MQTDAEALLLMRTFNLKNPPIYTLQFADKDVRRLRFKFPRVYQAINKYVELWKGLKSPLLADLLDCDSVNSSI
jgi:hypothetical protein